VTTLALPPELCVHHDVIEYPHGPISIGVCQKCRREREYQTPYDSPVYGGMVRLRFPKIVLARAEDYD